MEYKSRKVIAWLKGLHNGEIAFPDFQRDYVWKEKHIKDFLQAILAGRPIGTLLVLEVNKKSPQFEFEHRELEGISNKNEAELLVIDGQQRLTTLWKTLMNKGDERYYIKTQGLFDGDSVVDKIRVNPSSGIESESQPSGGAQLKAKRVEKDVARQRIPIGLLFGNFLEDEGNPELDEWCSDACGGSSEKASLLSSRIQLNLQRPIEDYEIWNCVLPKTMNDSEVATIFLKTNESAVKFRSFDYMVAHMQLRHGQNLRKMVENVRDKYGSGHLRSYLKPRREDWMNDLGEEILKIACLKMRKPVAPTKKGYEAALEEMCETEGKDGKGAEDLPKRLEREILKLGTNLVDALKFAEEQGAWTLSILPSWVPIHVLAALQDNYKDLRPQQKERARKIFACYFWRSVFGDRYNTGANKALLKDYKSLKEVLKKIQSDSPIKNLLAPIFGKNVKIVGKGNLKDWDNPTSWIGEGLVGKGLVALVYGQDSPPMDWITGSTLNMTEVRKLESSNDKGGNEEIHRHHIFPRAFLEESLSKDSKKLINHGLNGIMLKGASNYVLYKNDPAEYLKELREKNNATDGDLRRRMESHIVPYEKSIKDPESYSSVDDRYKAYLEKRSAMIAPMIERRTSTKKLLDSLNP